VNDAGPLFDVEDELPARPANSVPAPVVGASETDLTPVSGMALWGPLLDRLNVVAEADRRGLRPIGPRGHGPCRHRAEPTSARSRRCLPRRILTHVHGPRSRGHRSRSTGHPRVG